MPRSTPAENAEKPYTEKEIKDFYIRLDQISSDSNPAYSLSEEELTKLDELREEASVNTLASRIRSGYAFANRLGKTGNEREHWIAKYLLK